MKHYLFLLLAVSAFLLAGCSHTEDTAALPIEKGVSLQLNNLRKETISEPVYKLYFNIPARKTDPIAGNLTLSFVLNNRKYPVILDFQNPKQFVHQIMANGKISHFEYKNEHLIIPVEELKEGINTLKIDFTAGDLSLNRNDDFLYTLFVPARASTAFPCFDQPDLKARFELSLSIPKDWIAVANGALTSEQEQKNSTLLKFSETKPLPTYLFAFVAGKFYKVSRTIGGRNLTFYYRETDTAKVSRNLDDIFNIEAHAIQWMENYTGIPYPFRKFAFVAIPAFQYGGMEHPGVILFRANRIFLDKSATQIQKLYRATVISHETAHMWFGDLVTMKWFNDVWLKEVFANFFAAKISNPHFPKMNHQLSFLVDHFPPAYLIDRSAGANPIQQQLGNLDMAGTLYGNIIYHKAPIIMKMLENLVGKQKFQEGLRTYLKKYSYSNASWDDLIRILDQETTLDLANWSKVWVKEPGMPHYQTSMDNNKLIIHQTNAAKTGMIWPQYLDVLYIHNGKNASAKIFADKTADTLSLPADAKVLLLNGGGHGYGYFKLDSYQKAFLLGKNIFTLKPLQRAVAYMSLWENMQQQDLQPSLLGKAFYLFLQNETDELNVNLLLGYYDNLFWRFSDTKSRTMLEKNFEPLLWEKIQKAPDASLKSSYYHAWLSTALGKNAINKMVRLWKGSLKIKGLSLSESDMTALSYQLAVRVNEKTSKEIPADILQQQLKRITNPDRKAEMAFVIPALSSDSTVRDHFFDQLKKPEMREHEPWVNTALEYLNHPLRAKSSEKYIMPALELLPEIQRTGDIFFPKSWLDASLSGYNSMSAAKLIRDFLSKNPDLNPKLRQKVLQSADPVFRSAAILQGNANMK
jgi:aminopeptidase N